MKKKCFIVLLGIIVLIAIILFRLPINKTESRFYLEGEYYGSNTMMETSVDELNNLINKRESFVVFVYQPMCSASLNFEEVLSDFFKDHPISIYKIAFSNIKDTSISKNIKYYPSFIIYNQGKVVDFLEADKDEDVEFYTSKKGFEKWFTNYVLLKDLPFHENQVSDNKSTIEENTILKNINLKDVIKEEDKVNIYFFWGDGCPHCEEEFRFFESINEKYGDYYNLYTFETWYNEENAKLIHIFASSMGDHLKGVPYTIIGSKSFKGFSEKQKDEFISAIESQHKNSYDVYIDKIKQ